MGIGDFFKRNQPNGRHGGQASQNTGGTKHGSKKANQPKKQPKPPKGNTK